MSRKTANWRNRACQEKFSPHFFGALIGYSGVSGWLAAGALAETNAASATANRPQREQVRSAKSFWENFIINLANQIPASAAGPPGHLGRSIVSLGSCVQVKSVRRCSITLRLGTYNTKASGAQRYCRPASASGGKSPALPKRAAKPALGRDIPFVNRDVSKGDRNSEPVWPSCATKCKPGNEKDHQRVFKHGRILQKPSGLGAKRAGEN